MMEGEDGRMRRDERAKLIVECTRGGEAGRIARPWSLSSWNEESGKSREGEAKQKKKKEDGGRVTTEERERKEGEREREKGRERK